MIIKAKVSGNIDVSSLFYSNLLVKSIYLNTYFFKLKFLNIFNVNMNSFYFLSRTFYFFIQNYLSYYSSNERAKRYVKISKNRTTQLNFFIVLFSTIVRKKRTISKLV